MSCPPGVLCLEYITLICVLIAAALLLWFSAKGFQSESTESTESTEPAKSNPTPNSGPYSFILPPPRAQEVVFEVNPRIPVGPTCPEAFRQVGILAGSSPLLSLKGRPLCNDKWQYFSNTAENLRLPVIINGKDGSSEYGVPQLETGAQVVVTGMDGMYRVTMYNTFMN